MYSSAILKSPFAPRVASTITWHVGPFVIVYFLISLLDLRSELLAHKSGEQLREQCAICALSLFVVLLEVLMPQPTRFVKKRQLLQYRHDIKEKYKHFKQRSHRMDRSGDDFRSVSPSLHDSDSTSVRHRTKSGETRGREGTVDFSDDGLDRHNERSPLYQGDEDDLDDELEQDEDYVAAMEMLPDDDFDANAVSYSEKRLPPPEVKASIFGLATFTYMGGVSCHAVMRSAGADFDAMQTSSSAMRKNQSRWKTCQISGLTIKLLL